MFDKGKASNKVVAHIAHICRLSANLLFILFFFGALFAILGQSPENMKAWRINFSIQLMERSHLPFIGIALYSLSLMVNEDRKYRSSFYWKYLTIISALGIILYIGSLLNSSHRAYLSLKQSYIPSVSLNENLGIMQSSVNKISSIEEAIITLKNANQRYGKGSTLNDSDDLESIKEKIQKIESELLSERYTKQEKLFNTANRKDKFESLRYTLYSIIFIIFYLKLALFFNRLQRSS